MKAADELMTKILKCLENAEQYARKGNGYQWECIVNLSAAIILLTEKIEDQQLRK